jgi:hypothetical protein
MSKLNAKARNALPAKDFAGPGRSFPIEDKSHARNALARVANKSPEEKAGVRSKVSAKFPGIKQKTSEGRELERRLAAKDKR